MIIFKNYNYIKNYLVNAIKGIDKEILKELRSIAKELAKDAYMNRGYTIDTGDLISSTGVIIMQNGEILEIVGIGGTANGKAEAEKFANKIVQKYRGDNDYKLILIASMEYASIVEDRGFNVLYVTSVNSEQIYKKHIEIIKNKINKGK